MVQRCRSFLTLFTPLVNLFQDKTHRKTVMPLHRHTATPLHRKTVDAFLLLTMNPTTFTLFEE